MHVTEYYHNNKYIYNYAKKKEKKRSNNNSNNNIIKRSSTTSSYLLRSGAKTNPLCQRSGPGNYWSYFFATIILEWIPRIVDG
jgi:hypothetical protein